MCASHGPYGPYGGAYGALAPYFVSRANAARVNKAACANQSVQAACAACAACAVHARRTMDSKEPKETAEHVERVDVIGKIGSIGSLGNQLESGTSPELLQKIDAIVRKMNSFEASHARIIETQKRFGKELIELTADLDYDLANAMIDTVHTTKATVDVIRKELKLLQGDVDGMFERVMVTPLVCDIPSAILDYQNGESHELTRDDLNEMMRQQHGADVDVLGMSATNVLFAMLGHAEKSINRVNPVPTNIAKLLPDDEIARKQDLIDAFLRIVDKSDDRSITRYPCELLDFLHQFEPVDAGHALKALVDYEP